MVIPRKTKIVIRIVLIVVIGATVAFVALIGTGVGLWFLNWHILDKVQPGMTHAQVRAVLRSRSEAYVELQALPRGDPFRTYDDATFLDPKKLPELKIYRYKLWTGYTGYVAYDKAGRVAAVRKTHD